MYSIPWLAEYQILDYPEQLDGNFAAGLVLEMDFSGTGPMQQLCCCPTYNQFVLTLKWINQLMEVYNAPKDEESI